MVELGGDSRFGKKCVSAVGLILEFVMQGFQCDDTTELPVHRSVDASLSAVRDFFLQLEIGFKVGKILFGRRTLLNAEFIPFFRIVVEHFTDVDGSGAQNSGQEAQARCAGKR